ncbi:hypothetical protein FBU30_009498 [Linnemannia zychae]|nr:hypothetical protein FBU30_009498 [Linnemannia zychae]
MIDSTPFEVLCADFEDFQPVELTERISSKLGVRYLEETSPEPRKIVQGVVWGPRLRPIISLPVQVTDDIVIKEGTRKSINVHFLYYEVSPQTYISKEALEIMGIEEAVIAGEPLIGPNDHVRLPVMINGCRVDVARSPSNSHFSHLNILGCDLIHASGAKVYYGGNPPKFELAFP